MIVLDTILKSHLEAGGRSKYQALALGLRDAIETGTLAPGAQLPPVRDLAWRLGVTPGTVARAYAILTDENRLSGVVGRGTFVTSPSPAPRRDTAPGAADVDRPMTQEAMTGARWAAGVPEHHAHLLSPKLPDMGQVALLREGLRAMADTFDAASLLRYPGENAGLAAAETFLAALADAPVGPASVEDVVIGHGGQNVVLMILQTVLRGTAPVVAVDALSYNGFRSAAALVRAEVVGVPWDAEGPDPAAFEALVRTRGVQVYCTSSEVNNPTLAAVSLARRAAIARIAAQHGVHVIDDACYDRSPRRGASYRQLLPDHGWYVASPSKTLTAALRIGFGVAPRGWGERAVQTATFASFSVSRLVTDLYAWVMRHPDMPGIAGRIAGRIAGDVRAAARVLDGHRVAWDESVPFLWLDLPSGWRAGAFCLAAREAGVLIRPSEDFALRDSQQVHSVRIAVNGQVPEAVFADAMGRLRTILDAAPQRIST